MSGMYFRDLLRRPPGPNRGAVHVALARLKEVGGDAMKLSYEDQDVLLEAQRAGYFDRALPRLEEQEGAG